MWKMRYGPNAACFVVFFFLGASLARAQFGRGGNWNMVGNDPQRTGWQRTEAKISKDTVGKDFKFLWKLKLGQNADETNSYSEPLLIPSLLTSRGIVDLSLVGTANGVYAVDFELGTVFWEKHYDVPSRSDTSACDNKSVSLAADPPAVFDFKSAQAALARGEPPFPPLPAEGIPHYIGSETGGGPFVVRGAYVLTSDGYLHEQFLSNGADYAPPMKLLPHPSGGPHGLAKLDNVIYAEVSAGCGPLSGVWSMDVSTPAETIASYSASNINITGLDLPVFGADGSVYVVSGSGASDPAAGVYANSLLALTPKELKLKDWFTLSASSGPAHALKLDPVILTYNHKQLIAAPGKDRSLVLLDSQSLGGANHHTPLAETAAISSPAAESGSWGRLATWQDGATPWILAAIGGPVATAMKFDRTNGAAPHGSVVAFKVEGTSGPTILRASWVSRDLISPAPPVVANGVVFVLSGGDAKHHATLYALDGETGKELYSSEDAIHTYARLAGISISTGQVFFVTVDNTLYCFGIPLEH